MEVPVYLPSNRNKTPPSSSPCLGDQELLLVKLKNTLIFNASVSSKLVTWNQNARHWNGVTCDKDGKVISLDLSFESISCNINSSSSLFRLKHLQKLNLAFNDFKSSAIPSGFTNLSGLVYLNLSNAGFYGQIPIEIARLRKLMLELSIHDLSLLYFRGTDTLKLKNPNLKTLIRNLTELRQLHLDGIDLSSEGNERCNALSSSVRKLHVLSMSNCFLSGPVDSSLVNLHHLEIPSKIFQVQTLRILDLSGNQLLQGPLPNFPEDSSLETLVLTYTSISGRLPDSIGNLRKLSRLELSNCRLSGSILSSMENLSELTYLDLSLNNLTGSVPSFSMSKNLRQIMLFRNALTGEIKSTRWAELLSLVYLDLLYNSPEGSVPPSLFILPSVKIINLSNNQFSGELSGSLNVTCYQLTLLDLSSNNLEGPIPAYVFELRGLSYLLLSSNNFSGSLHIDAFQRLKNLTYLDLSHNGLSINATASTSAMFSFPLYTL
ncbi:receptor-like protein 7 [Syzygium oleosum]|uniref:receptor-like protein 7 n=1 Tax=Syzygium oleosum TaxID=219896 RepID=UPI0024BA0E2D|nr:receptor-like protein 7 [Syzygium oleosum]